MSSPEDYPMSYDELISYIPAAFKKYVLELGTFPAVSMVSCPSHQDVCLMNPDAHLVN